MSSLAIPSQSILCLSPIAGMDDTPPSATILTIMHEIKQGQSKTSILSPTKPIPSLSRTSSAYMSSRNWLSCEGLPPKGQDRLPLHIEDSSDEEEEGSRVEIWNLIQEEKRKTMLRDQGEREFDSWSSITSLNKGQLSESEAVPPLYVHPLMRRSSSCLSEKSLEICTESLGSETGSDGFSSFSPSETRGLFSSQRNEGEKNESFFFSAFRRTDGMHDFDAKRSFHAPAGIPRNKQRSRSFPPPLPSLTPAADRASLRMQSRRENGRLVLEAVTVPDQKNFQACRENGRLTLAFTANDVEPCDRDFIPDRSTEEQEEADEVEEGCRDRGDDTAENDDAVEEGIQWIISKKTESTVEIATSSPHIDCIGKLKIPKIAIMMNKQDEVSVFFKGINEEEVEINSVPIKLPQPLPSIAGARVATAANPLNVYEYFWRTKPGATAAAVTDPSETTLKSYRNEKKYVISHNDRDFAGSIDQREVQIRFKNIEEDCWVSVMKDSKRSLFFLEPRCIATS